MSLHNEIAFETDICNHLAAQGWLYSEPGTEGDASGYDTPRALYPADLLAWVQATQPQAWEALVKNHGAAAPAMLLDRLRKALDDRGTLEVLRVGIDLLGLKSPLKLAQFKPALAMNPDLQARYAANRLRVVRQCRTGHDDVIDLGHHGQGGFFAFHDGVGALAEVGGTNVQHLRANDHVSARQLGLTELLTHDQFIRTT